MGLLWWREGPFGAVRSTFVARVAILAASERLWGGGGGGGAYDPLKSGSYGDSRAFGGAGPLGPYGPGVLSLQIIHTQENFVPAPLETEFSARYGVCRTTREMAPPAAALRTLDSILNYSGCLNSTSIRFSVFINFRVEKLILWK